MRTNILICGSTTYGNKGDDAIRNVLAGFLNETVKCNIKVTRPFPQKEFVEWADKVIIGGGGILYDYNQANFDYFIKDYLTWANELNKDVCLCSVGTQKFTEPDNIEYFKSQLGKTKFVSVRHKEDRDFFIKNNLNCNLFLADDVAFLTRKAPFTFTSKTNKPKLCIIPNIMHPLENYLTLTYELSKIFDVYVTMTSYEDLNYLETISKVIDNPGSVRDFKYLSENGLISFLGEMDYVLTGRFHGQVFASVGGCKNIFTLSNSHKHTSQLHEENILYDEFIKSDNHKLINKLALSKEMIRYNNSFNHLVLLKKFIENIL